MAERNWKEQTLDTNTDVWNKEKPIEGKLVRIETNVGPNDSKMYTFLTDDGEVKVWGSTVLDDKLMGVPLQTYVKIDYEGKIKGKKGTSYHSYHVFVDVDSMPQATAVDEVFPDAEEIEMPDGFLEKD